MSGVSTRINSSRIGARPGHHVADDTADVPIVVRPRLRGQDQWLLGGGSERAGQRVGGPGHRVEECRLAGTGGPGEDHDQRSGGIAHPRDEVIADGADDPVASGDQPAILGDIGDRERLEGRREILQVACQIVSCRLVHDFRDSGTRQPGSDVSPPSHPRGGRTRHGPDPCLWRSRSRRRAPRGARAVTPPDGAEHHQVMAEGAFRGMSEVLAHRVDDPGVITGPHPLQPLLVGGPRLGSDDVNRIRRLVLRDLLQRPEGVAHPA